MSAPRLGTQLAPPPRLWPHSRQPEPARQRRGSNSIARSRNVECGTPASTPARTRRAAVDLAPAAGRRLGIEPRSTLTHGGADGSRLTEMGVPTPPLFTGVQNIHNPREWVSVQDTSRAVAMSIGLAQLWGNATRVATPERPDDPRALVDGPHDSAPAAAETNGFDTLVFVNSMSACRRPRRRRRS